MLENKLEVEEVVNLIENKKINELKKYLERINGADFPTIFEELDEEDILVVFRLLNKERAAEIFTELDSDLQEKLINSFSDVELKNVVDKLFMDDTVDIIEEMPSNVVKRILRSVDEKDRKVINEILNYPEDSAGSIMTTEFIDLKEEMNVAEAFEKIKKIGLKKETVYNSYILDKNRKLIGVIDIKDLLLADRNQKLKEIMDTNVITVTTHDDREDVTKIFDKYDYVALPVVDKEGRLVGIVTVDDAIDVIMEETSEDFEKMTDYTSDLVFTAREKRDKDVHFSEKARQEITIMVSAVGEIIDLTINAFSSDDVKMANKVEPLEDVIDRLRNDLKNRHIRRMQEGRCSVNQGFVGPSIVATAASTAVAVIFCKIMNRKRRK